MNYEKIVLIDSYEMRKRINIQIIFKYNFNFLRSFFKKITLQQIVKLTNFYKFNVAASQDFIGHVDVKTKTVHFYVQRNSSFGTSDAIIPFQLAQLNEGNAFNLKLGIFTVPVPGIYNFYFSALKSDKVIMLWIFLKVNGAKVGSASNVRSTTGGREVVSLSASLRLVAGDRVYLSNDRNGVLYDDENHVTHFSGWLVEEELV